MKLEELEKKYKELGEEIDRLKACKKGFRSGDTYYFVNPSAIIACNPWTDHYVDKDRFKAGNAFKTEEEARASLIYQIMNSKYHYWMPGVSLEESKPDSKPDGLEYFDTNDHKWLEARYKPSMWLWDFYRWPKEAV